MKLCAIYLYLCLGPVDGDYWILDTDYENYSIVYSCVDYIFGLIHFGLYIYLFCNLCSVCLFVCLIITQEPLDQLASNFVWGTPENHGNVLSFVLLF